MLTDYTLYTPLPITFRPAQNEIVIEKQSIKLEPLQVKLLLFFIEQRGQVISVQKIANAVWDRSMVSDNLVRQVISSLRAHLNDTQRPYQIIQTISKQGYLFDIQCEPLSITHLPENPQILVSEQSNIITSSMQSSAKYQINAFKKRPFWGILVVAIILFIGTLTYSLSTHYLAPKPLKSLLNSTQSVYLHELTLDSPSDFKVGQSVFNYLFYGLNSTQNIAVYHVDETNQSLLNHAVEIKGWLKSSSNEYQLQLLIEDHRKSTHIVKLNREFSKDDFLTVMSDLTLELQTRFAAHDAKNGIVNHRITAVENYSDWEIISDGVSLFYQGKGLQKLDHAIEKIKQLQRKGHQSYLSYALLSYAQSIDFLRTDHEVYQQQALQLARKAFELNPRCDIANLSLGLALILNHKSDEAYPYLVYASDVAPSALSFYLLSVADKQLDNLNGASKHYQCFDDMKKEMNGQLFELIASKHNSNIDFKNNVL